MTTLLDIFNEAMRHPAGSAEREAGLAQLGEAIKAQARGVENQYDFSRTKIFWGNDSSPDWAKRAANDTDWD